MTTIQSEIVDLVTTVLSDLYLKFDRLIKRKHFPLFDQIKILYLAVISEYSFFSEKIIIIKINMYILNMNLGKRTLVYKTRYVAMS